MMLLEQDHEKYAQFLHYTGNKRFGDFKIDHHSSQAVAETDYASIQKHFDIPEILRQIYQMVSSKGNKMMSSSARKRSLKSTITSMSDIENPRAYEESR